MSENNHKPMFNFFLRIIELRWAVLIASLVILAFFATQVGSLQKNTQTEAFINQDAPSLVYREKVEEIFNLKDPIIVAIVNETDQGIYNKESLNLVKWFSHELKQVENIDPDVITSLSTESNIEGTEDGMVIDKFVENDFSDEHIQWVKKSVDDFPLYQGTLVSKDGRATVIIAELLDQAKADRTYLRVMDLVERAPKTENDQIYVAGEGALTGYISLYIDMDAEKLNPIAAVIIMIVLLIAFFRGSAIVIPKLVVLGTVLVTLGAMAATGVEFFVITNGLIVCMIGIAVADGIHVFSEYYETLAKNPEWSKEKIIATAMNNMFRPITLTTLTTSAGFCTLYFTSDMPPLQFFGVFGAVAVVAAWAFTIFVLPCLLQFIKLKPSRAIQAQHTQNKAPWFAILMSRLSISNPKVTATITIALIIIGIYGAGKVIVNEQVVGNFRSDEPVYISDKKINQYMNGAYYIDVVVETDNENGIYEYATLQKIEELQTFLNGVTDIHGVTSINDYIKQMNKAANEGDSSYYRIPQDENLTAQLFFVYSASGDPTDFDNIIDSQRQTTLVRAYLKTDSYLVIKEAIPKIEQYLEANFTTDEITANISGIVNVSYHWVKGISDSHIASVLIAFMAVFIISAILFRSVLAGLMVSVPVGLAILVIYAIMGLQNIWLGVGTSMFASIAIGLSVDFAIHMLSKIKEAFSTDSEEPLENRMVEVFQSTGRALWFNFLAIGFGFSVLMFSQTPPLQNFGMLVSLSVAIAFLASVILLPLLSITFKPKFLFQK
jgi:predicted RND superfamily exporter protein